MPLKNSIIHNKITNFYYKLLTDRKHESPSVEPQPAAKPEIEMMPEQPAIAQEKQRSFAAREQRFSIEGIANKTDDRAEGQSTVLTR